MKGVLLKNSRESYSNNFSPKACQLSIRISKPRYNPNDHHVAYRVSTLASNFSEGKKNVDFCHDVTFGGQFNCEDGQFISTHQ